MRSQLQPFIENAEIHPGDPPVAWVPGASVDPSARAARTERVGMAWPPAEWERAPGEWRPDPVVGADPFVPYAADVGALDLPAPAAPAHHFGTLAREVVETIVLTLLIFFGIRLVVQNFKIEGSSMEPTLHTGQYLLVSKLAYRGSSEPQRGDIIVFKSWTPGKDFIKRVIGVPGETIEIRDNAVWVNNERLEEKYLDQVTTGPSEPVHLAEEEYFVMGDNRSNSSDSRNHGVLKGENVIGKAWVTYWPVNDVGFIPDSSESYASTGQTSP